MESSVLSEYYDSLSRVRILNKEEEKSMYFKYIQGDPQAGALLVESCLRLCFSIAKTYWKDQNPETLKDLISAGNEGLLKALKKFDPSKDVKFSTYSAYWILMYIRKHVVEDSKVVKPPIAVRRKSKLKEAQNDSNIVYKEAAEYNCVCPRPTPEQEVINQDTNAVQTFMLDNLLRFLTSRERMVLQYCFGDEEQSPKSLSYIGKKLSLSSERVRQIKEAALQKLKDWSVYFV